jgi:RND family efflux transporter MFP subunit
MRRTAAILAIVGALGAGLAWLLLQGEEPPEVNFAKVRRDRLVSRLVTNGRIVAGNDTPVASPRDGILTSVGVREGQPVQAGAVIAQLDAEGYVTELAAARAREAEAQTELATLEAGGSSSARAELDAAIARVAREISDSRGRVPAIERLVEKNAAPRVELEQLRQRIAALESEQKSLGARRAAIADPANRRAAEARLTEAQAAIAGIERRRALGAIRTPVGGTVYELAIRTPGHVRAGDVIARIGQTGKLRAIVYVDEPELGRVRAGMPVKITWDAVPKREWAGKVARMPSRIVALNARQVGEVECVVSGSGEGLLPGANINAELITEVVEGATLVPTGAVRRQGTQTGVFVLAGDGVEWRAVTTGASSITDTQIISGASDGESVALGAYESLASGDRVTPRHP